MDGKKSGQGKIVYKDGPEYEGDIKSLLFRGFGMSTFSKEDELDYFEGHRKNDRKSGKALLVLKDGQKIERYFINGNVCYTLGGHTRSGGSTRIIRNTGSAGKARNTGKAGKAGQSRKK